MRHKIIRRRRDQIVDLSPLRPAVFDHPAIVHLDDPTTDTACQFQIVRHHHDSQSLFIQVRQQRRDLPGIFVIKIPRRLIRKNHLRPLDQRPCNRHALLLAAGQRTRTMFQPVAHSQAGQDFARAFVALVTRCVIEIQGDFDIAKRRMMRKQIKCLENHPHLARAISGETSAAKRTQHRLTNRDTSRSRRIEPGQQIQERRLAGAGGSDNTDKLTAYDIEINTSQRRGFLADRVDSSGKVLSWQSRVRSWYLI